jgi:hypothetical protein
MVAWLICRQISAGPLDNRNLRTRLKLNFLSAEAIENTNSELAPVIDIQVAVGRGNSTKRHLWRKAGTGIFALPNVVFLANTTCCVPRNQLNLPVPLGLRSSSCYGGFYALSDEWLFLLGVDPIKIRA